MAVTNGSLKLTSPIVDALMCSSPAYPISAPLGGFMTGDRAAMGGPVTPRSEDMTEISFKGLLPQLIDVLHALTEGQELLSRKIREARLEGTCDSSSVVERCLQAEPSDFAAPRSFVGTSPSASIGIDRESPTDDVEPGGGTTTVNGFGNGSLAEPNTGASAAPVCATIPEAAPPSSPPAATVTHAGTSADLLSETSARIDWLNSTLPGEATRAPSNRDYNFFDELDARLADRQDPVDRSGEC